MSGRSEKRATEQTRLEFSGDAVSPGIGIGPAYVIDRGELNVPRRHINKFEVNSEIERFLIALRKTQEDLELIKSKLPQGEHRQILKAQQMMVRDPHLIQHVETMVRDDLLNVEWAFRNAIDEIRETLGAVGDEYFRERQLDVAFIGTHVLRNLAGEQGGEICPPDGAVVVAVELSPADTAQLHRSKVAGIVMAEGGHTSHSAIMARAMSIPAVVGIDVDLDRVETGDVVIVDAIQASVVIRPLEKELDSYRQQFERYMAFEAEVHKEHALPAVTRDGTRVVLRGNLAFTDEVNTLKPMGAEGIGLYRTEYMFMDRNDPPSEEEHYRVAKKILQQCAPYSVCVRTFDLGSDKKCKIFAPSHHEANPALGLRGLRLALREREHFLAQLRGLLRAALHGPLQIMMPMVSGLQELRMGLEAVEEAREQLEDAGMPYAKDVPVGIMVEVPSAAVVADVLAQKVDFMSIGTNDLIQYTLAIDRENDEVNYLYNPLHPALLRLIHQVCEAGRRYDISVSLCGEMAADPRFTWVLIGLGLHEMSMHPAAVPVIKNIIRASDLHEMRSLAERVLETESAGNALALVNAEMRSRFPEHMLHGAGTTKPS